MGKIDPEALGYYFINNRKLSRKPVIETIADAIRGGAKAIQYREKDLPMTEVIQQAREVSELCREKGVLLIINDHIDVAVSIDADGIHIGQRDAKYAEAREAMGPDKIVGVSASSVAQAVAAAEAGADYVGIGPIFHTYTKRDAGRAIGLSTITQAKSKLSIPIVGIGGITLENCASVIRAGADGVCAISDVIGSDDIAERVSEYLRLVADAKSGK